MRRRLACISRATCATRIRSCARRKISSISGPVAAGIGRAACAASSRESIAATCSGKLSARPPRLSTALSASRMAVAYSMATASGTAPDGGIAVEPADQRRRQSRQRLVADLGGVSVHRLQRLLQPRQALGTAQRDLHPDVLRRGELLAHLAQDGLEPDQVRVQRGGRRNEPREAEAVLDRPHDRRHRRAHGDVIEHLAPQSRGNLRRALDDASDLKVEPRGKLLCAEARFQSARDDGVEERADGPPEHPCRFLCADALHPRGRVAHLARAVAIAAQEREEAALVDPALLEQMRRAGSRRGRAAEHRVAGRATSRPGRRDRWRPRP